MKDAFNNNIHPDMVDFYKKCPNMGLIEGRIVHKSRVFHHEGHMYPMASAQMIPLEHKQNSKMIMVPNGVRGHKCGTCGIYVEDASGKCNTCKEAPYDRNRKHCYHCDCGHCHNVKRPKPGSDGKLLLGVELELNQIPNQHLFFTEDSTIENDGSLHKLGAEVVTSPMVFADHERFWAERFEAGAFEGCLAPVKYYGPKYDDPGFAAIDWSTYKDCHGMHVHVSKNWLEEDEWIRLIAAIHYNLHDVVTKIGGRRSGEYRRFYGQKEWTKYGHEFEEDEDDTPDDEKSEGRRYIMPKKRGLEYIKDQVENGADDHGIAMNPTDYTVEFRFCKSSTSYDVIIGRIGLVESLTCFVREFTNKPWTQLTEDLYIQYLSDNKKRWPRTWWLHRLNKMI